MNNSNYPLDRPDHRKAILILGRADAIFFKHDNPGLYALSSRSENIPEYLRQHLNKKGEMLIQNPYDTEKYKTVSKTINSEDDFSVEKHEIFLTFCQHLGVKRVTIASSDHKLAKAMLNFQLRAGIKASDLQIADKGECYAEGEIIQANEATFFSTFKGHPADFTAAELLLKEHGLTDDNEMIRILEQRKNPNTMLTKRREIRTMREFNARIEFARELKLDLAYLSADARAALEASVKISREKNYFASLEF